MKIHELFLHDVTRDIPPVVYFHEDSPDKLLAEVSEYIVTGGWEKDHPRYKSVRVGIHEHYVQLLTGIASAVDGAGAAELPACWISGLYGSGKSSFAKLFGMALDGRKLPDGSALADAWIGRDRSQRAPELRKAWDALHAKLDPIAVVFDIGGVSRGDEHIHAAVVRQVQARLEYCDKESLVADFELKLERDGRYEEFLAVVEQVHGKPWAQVRTMHMVEDAFSLVLHKMFPDLYPESMTWLSARDGLSTTALSADDAARAIQDMLRFRGAGKTLFIVIDEVSQYIFQDGNRMLALQSLVSALGQRLKGSAWLLATGQQQLDDQNDSNVLGKMKDRFPESLRVHLASTNIRDVVHKRLLQKKPEQEAALRKLFQDKRSNLRLFGYKCEDLSEEDFVDVYPMLPQHVDLILQVTSAIRTRSERSQGDDHAIRGLLQMLGELFRRHGLAELELGALITLDRIYEVQSSALNPDVQNTMARILDFCGRAGNELAARCARAVALLELLQRDDGGLATDAKLVSRCLYANVSDGDNESAVTEALEVLRRENLLGYSERSGYKIQSSAGQDWERERRDITVPSDELYESVREALEGLVGAAERPKIEKRGFPWYGLFSNESSVQEQPLRMSREEGPVTIDFRFVPMELQDVATWVNRSTESSYRGRIIWVAGQFNAVMDAARRYGKSRRMAKRYAAKRASLQHDQRRLLHEEEAREEDLLSAFRRAVADAYMGGTLYFAGANNSPEDYGTTFTTALLGVGNKRVKEIYNQFSSVNVTPGELKQISTTPLSGPARLFFEGDLGILEEDAGRIVATCSGPISTRVFELIQREQGISGATMLRKFSEPPYGYPANVIKACVAGLLHAGKVRLIPQGEAEITSVADVGVQDLFDKDRAFKTTDIFPAGEARIKPQDRARIREMFATVFGRQVEPENEAIADVVGLAIPPMATKLREVERALNRLPGRPDAPPAIQKLERAFEDCLRKRQVEPTVLALRQNLEVLTEGVGLLNAYASELTDDVIVAVNRADVVIKTHLAQLYEVGMVSAELSDAERQIAEQLKQSKPWRDIRGIEAAVDRIRNAYVDERRRRIAHQDALAEQAREVIKALPDMARVSADERHAVLRPIAAAVRETTDEAIAPTLAQILDGLAARLEEAKVAARDLLDSVQRDATGEVTVKVTFEIRDREIRSEKDVEALLDEIRTRLLDQLKKGPKVRLRLS
jgi:hypothetical protein